MSLEQNVAELVQATNNLTGTVSGMIGEIDNRVLLAESQFQDYISRADTVGDPAVQGTLFMGIFQGGVWGTGGPNLVGASGGFPVTDLGTTSEVYAHFKLPLNINRDECMFWLNFRGYSYGSACVIDETIAGYCYAPQRKVINQSLFGVMDPAIYVDTVGNVVLRLKFPSIYVTTLRIDTMQTGIGAPPKKGELVAKLSLATEVDF